MSIELRPCYLQGWAFCDGNCEKCRTTATTTIKHRTIRELWHEAKGRGGRMNCAYCKHADGVVYTSNPPKYKCNITGEYHLALDDCNVDFEPVVRCKDCKWYIQVNKGMCNNYGMEFKPDDYCSYGEREFEKVKHGRWVHKYGDGHEELAILGGECSICGYVHTATPYCPNCGARMDEVEE